MKTVAKVIAWLLLVLLVIGAISGILFMTDGGNEDFKSFTLSHEGRLIVNAESTAEFEAGSTQHYDVKYIFDLPNGEPRGYSVKVIPNPAADFEFTVDGTTHAWRSAGDLTGIFIAVKEDDGFKLHVSADCTTQKVLEMLHVGHEVEIGKQVGESDYPFVLIVSSYNEKVTYCVYFRVLEEPEAYQITLGSFDAGNLSGEEWVDALSWVLSDVDRTYVAGGTNVVTSVTMKDYAKWNMGYGISGVKVRGRSSGRVYNSVYFLEAGILEFTMPDEAVILDVSLVKLPVTIICDKLSESVTIEIPESVDFGKEFTFTVNVASTLEAVVYIDDNVQLASVPLTAASKTTQSLRTTYTYRITAEQRYVYHWQMHIQVWSQQPGILGASVSPTGIKVYAAGESEQDCPHEMTFHEEVPATCMDAGTKEYYSCSLCGKNFADEEGNTSAGSLTIKALSHKKTIVFNMPATCTRAGWKSYEYCTRERCDYTTYTEIPALGHAEVTDEAISPTCTEAGKTAGSHCSRCGLVLTAQEEMEPLGHDFKDGTCTICGEADPDYVEPDEPNPELPQTTENKPFHWLSLLFGLGALTVLLLFIINVCDGAKERHRSGK